MMLCVCVCVEFVCFLICGVRQRALDIARIKSLHGFGYQVGLLIFNVPRLTITFQQQQKILITNLINCLQPLVKKTNKNNQMRDRFSIKRDL